MDRLRGAIAASVTPLSRGGDSVDVAPIPTLTSFLAEEGVDGVLACGTTGEGVSLDEAERRAVVEAFVASAPGGFAVAVHAGAQTSRETQSLATHAREVGAAAVAVIAPPYFALDDDEITRHLVGAANAADPLPFYVYEFAARSGYAIAPSVVARVRGEAPNVVGMKVSDSPFAAVEPYLGLGLDVFVGSESLALEGLAAGALGSVSGLAAAFPEITATLVHERSATAHDQVCRLRRELVGVPFHAALKHVLVARGVLIDDDVRRPLRPLTEVERERLLHLARDLGVVR